MTRDEQWAFDYAQEVKRWEDKVIDKLLELESQLSDGYAYYIMSREQLNACRLSKNVQEKVRELLRPIARQIMETFKEL